MILSGDTTDKKSIEVHLSQKGFLSKTVLEQVHQQQQVFVRGVDEKVHIAQQQLRHGGGC